MCPIEKKLLDDWVSRRHNVHTLALNKDGQLMMVCYPNKRLSLNLQQIPTDKKLPDEWVSNHMDEDHPEDLANFAFAYNNEPYVVFDLARVNDDKFINWGTIECMKNGCIFSGKYESPQRT